MPYPDNLLVTGEKIYVRKRPHWKVLILPFIFFVLIIGGCAALLAFLNGRDWPSWVVWAIVGVAVVALIVLVLVPFIRWRTEHFVISNHHIFFRTGLLSRREHQIPLGQIANIETEVTFWGRLMGYGSLIVESSADQPLKFRNVANLSKVQSMLNQLIRDEKELLHRGHLEVDDWAAADTPDDRERQPPTGPTTAGAQPAAQPGTGQWPAQPGTGQPGTGQWPAQQGAPQGGQPAYGQQYGSPGNGPGYPAPQPGYTQAYPPPGQPQGYPPAGQGYPPPGYQPGPGYPANYPPQAGYPQGYPPSGGYPPPAGYPGGGPQGYPPAGYPTGAPQGYPPAGYQQGYQQPTDSPATGWGVPPSGGSSPAVGEPPASAEPTVYTRSPAARPGDGGRELGNPADEPDPTVLTRSPTASGSASPGVNASSGANASAGTHASSGSDASAAGASTAEATGATGTTRGRHAHPTESTPLPNFDDPEPTVLMRSPTADATSPADDAGTGPAGPNPRP